MLHYSSHRARFFYGLCLSLMLALPVVAKAEKPAIVASVPPVAAITYAITEGVFEPKTLLTGLQSPHHFSLKPSQLRAMRQADVLVLIHPDYERFLQKALATVPPEVTVIVLADAPGLKKLPPRLADGHPAAKGFDPHLWLDPENVTIMGNFLSGELAKKYPEDAEHFRANAVKLQEKMAELRTGMASTLAPYKGEKFAAYHDGYQYFERVTGILLGATFSDPVLHQLRPRQLQVIQKEAGATELRCLVAEPEFDSTVIRSMGDQLHMPVIISDPEGMTITAHGAGFFTALLQGMASEFAGCLAAR